MTKFEVGKTYLHTLDTGAGMRFRIDARTEKMATVTIHPGGDATRKQDEEEFMIADVWSTSKSWTQ